MSKAVFITGTGTDMGKTYLSGLIVKKLAQAGKNPAYYKAAMSGNDRRADGSLIPGDALFVRHVPHDDVPEVRLAGHRAERGVFRAVELDDVVAVGVDVLKRLKPRGVGGVRIVAFRGRQQRQVAEPFPVLFGVHIGPVL